MKEAHPVPVPEAVEALIDPDLGHQAHHHREEDPEALAEARIVSNFNSNFKMYFVFLILSLKNVPNIPLLSTVLYFLMCRMKPTYLLSIEYF